jgi:glycyl-tRNA synthetase
MMTLQSAILALQHFWADRGCLLAQPYYAQVGAGTMNPATFLRVLGPEPWRVAYVEPSVRPDDGRYGENPNRMQQHFQFQVILKPDPGRPQETYLESLVALGIDPARHDLRFVEDNWESPALGAWGLGWEVWLDGQEITQFTYFQQAGGQSLDPVSVEITYGLERILMALQGVEHFKDLAWDEVRSYGDLQMQAEREHSRYYFETADVERLAAMFGDFEAEARSALERGLVLPAYDYVLKCSHAFNVMDTRGAIGVTERAALFGRMRDLSRGVAEAYVEQRRELGFPWLADPPATMPPAAARPAGPPPEAPSAFLFEVGTEELPVADLQHALNDLTERVPLLLDEARLKHGPISVDGTPRRLVIAVEALAPRQADYTESVKGPPESRAFDAGGQPTPAALGWAKKQGIPADPAGLRALVAEAEGGRYLVHQARREGEPAEKVLSEQFLPRLMAGLTFERSMRWLPGANDPDGKVAFSRPIRWLVALHGSHRVPFGYGGVRTREETRGLRFSTPETMRLDNASAHHEAMRSQGISLGVQARRESIWAEATRLASAAGGHLTPDDDLLTEIANLVEAPAPLLGSFNPDHLDLPEPVLIAVMKKHQRYFPVWGKDGRLLPHFVAVANGERTDLEQIRKGNEHVIRARFADADYFIRRDLERPLEAYLPQLERIAFQTRLGSMLDKVNRVKLLTAMVAQSLGLAKADLTTALRVAELSKADLATSMVMEMTSLQGEMGRYYARQSGEPEAVAEALYDYYLPRFAGDGLPSTRAGLAVGLADRLDTLLGLFAVGLQPTGTRDPFGLRRTAIGLIQCLVGAGQRFDLRQALEQARPLLKAVDVSHEAIESCLAFIAARHEALLLAEGKAHDIVQAVLHSQAHDPAGARRAVEDFEQAVRDPQWPTTLQAFARCVRILRTAPAPVPSTKDLQHPAEKALEAGLARAESTARAAGSVEDFLRVFRPLVPPITSFFEDVLVMSEDRAERDARLALLARVVSLADGVADFSKLEGF